MISVVVPAYNAERTLAECLMALSEQCSSEPFEVIVADDGSTDGTASIAAALGARVVRQPRRGPAAARNLGLGAALGDTILFTDSDCVPAMDWVTQMTARLADETVAAVKGAYVTRQRAVVARLAQLEFEERYALLERLSFIDFFDTYALALRKAALTAQGNFDTFFAAANNEDVDLAYRLAGRGYRIVFNRRAVVYHQHAASWGAYARLKFWRGYWRMQVYQRYPQKMLADSYTPQSLKIQTALAALLIVLWCVANLGWLPIWTLLGACLLFVLSGWQLLSLAWRIDRSLTPVVPLFLFVRGLAIGLGSVTGLLTVFRVLPVFRPGPESARQRKVERI